MFDYIKSLIKDGSGDSSKSFALVLSAIVGAFIALTIGVVLIIDAAKDGMVSTDMTELGFLLISDGIFMVGGATSKTIIDRMEFKNKRTPKPTLPPEEVEVDD